MSSRIRKCQSGYEKRQKKKKKEILAQSLKGGLNRFFAKESNVSSENQSVDANTNDVHDDDTIHTETQGEETNVDSNMDEVHVENRLIYLKECKKDVTLLLDNVLFSSF